MKRYLIKIIFLICMCLICPLSASAEVDWSVQQIIDFEQKPVDIVMSSRGSYMYVLTEDGIIHIYDSSGNLKGRIEAGKNVDQIASGSKENILILKSKKNKEIRTISVEFIKEINIEGSPYKGNADAPVVIVVFTDYQCGYCGRLLPKLNQVIEKNKDTVKIVTKNLPLRMHKNARKAAAAALTAYSMGKFDEFHEELYKNAAQLDDKKVGEMATSFGLNPDEFIKEMKSKKIQNEIKRDMRDAEKAGVRATPTVFVNGRRLKNLSITGFQHAIDAQLKK
ncbi:MAG: thioredoxin domain-containing protein [Desulfobacteraceae bacterium]